MTHVWGKQQESDTVAIRELRRLTSNRITGTIKDDVAVAHSFMHLVRELMQHQGVKAETEMGARLALIEVTGFAGVNLSLGDAQLLLCVWDAIRGALRGNSEAVNSPPPVAPSAQQGARNELSYWVDRLRKVASRKAPPMTMHEDRQAVAAVMRDQRMVEAIFRIDAETSKLGSIEQLRAVVTLAIQGGSWLYDHAAVVVDAYDAVYSPLSAEEMRELARARRVIEELERKRNSG